MEQPELHRCVMWHMGPNMISFLCRGMIQYQHQPTSALGMKTSQIDVMFVAKGKRCNTPFSVCTPALASGKYVWGHYSIHRVIAEETE